MTNIELNKLSILELRNLNIKVVEMIKLKMQIEGRMNVDNLQIDMVVKYKGHSEKLKNETFKIVKINKINAQCENITTKVVWNIKLANIEPINDIA